MARRQERRRQVDQAAAASRRNPQEYAKNNDPKTWGTYEEALAAFDAGQCDGIGFNLLGTDIAAFDLDKCRDPVTGGIAPEAMELVDRAALLYEITPSAAPACASSASASGAKVHRKQKIPGRLPWRSRAIASANATSPSPATRCPAPAAYGQMVDIGDVIDAVVAELDGVKPNGSGGTKPDDPQDWRSDLDKWIKVNGNRHASDRRLQAG